jgi:hypothetical protein
MAPRGVGTHRDTTGPLAVPEYNWATGPMEAVADGLTDSDPPGAAGYGAAASG